MRNALLIAGRELRSYLRSPLGPIVAAAMLLADGLLFQVGAMAGTRLSAQVLADFFYWISGITMIGAIALSMRLIAHERVLTAYMPLLIFVNGRVSIGHILVGYLGILLLAAASTAIGLFASAFAKTQVI